MVYNYIMPITFLDSASTSEQSTFALIQLYLVNKTMHHIVNNCWSGWMLKAITPLYFVVKLPNFFCMYPIQVSTYSVVLSS